nr:DNA replication factor C complex subunit 3 [Cryptomonas paramecium]
MDHFYSFEELVSNEDMIFALYKISCKLNNLSILISSFYEMEKECCFFSFCKQLLLIHENYDYIKLDSINEHKSKVVCEIIKNFIETDFFDKNIKKITMITNFEYMSFQQQSFLRKYLETTLYCSVFWLECSSFIQVNNSIYSRCVKIFLKKQGFLQFSARLKEIFQRKKIKKISLQILEKIISTYQLDLKTYTNVFTQNVFLIYKRTIVSAVLNQKFTVKLNAFFFKECFNREQTLSCIRKIFYIYFKNHTRIQKINHVRKWLYFHNLNFFFE